MDRLETYQNLPTHLHCLRRHFFEQLWGVVYHVTYHGEHFPPHEYHYEVITQREVEVLHANAMGSL